MIVEFISVGTEILLGNIVNTNANYLSQRCAELGISNYYQVSVGDNEERLSKVIESALSRSDIVILTGGLGPTKDDLTKEVTAKTLNKNLIEDPHTKKNIQSYFADSNLVGITENNWKQALIIEDSTVVDNQNGTAPGLIVNTDEGKTVILLPGPPNEMIPMFDQDIYPYLDKLQPGILYSEMVKICGIGESKAETMIYDLIDQQTNPTIAPYAKTGEVHLRVTASATNLDEGKTLVRPMVDELKKRFMTNIYTTNEKENLEDVVVQLLSKHHVTLSTAESCTGGLLSGRIVNVSGVSAIFSEGFITYSNESKQKYLKVESNTLKKFGAVSKETALEMAAGVVAATASSASIAITGLAGPDGGSKDKPVGLVYIACALNGNLTVKEFHFKGNRQKIRDNTVTQALDMLRNVLIKEYENKSFQD
jgi:nicotinamide-nucleotide amidase